jgi:hypothetical protein
MGVGGNAPDCHADGAVAQGQACILSKNDGTWFFGTITTIAESPVLPGVLWAGTDDGNVQVSRDGIAAWTNVTANLRGAPQNCYVSRIEGSHADAATAYAALDCHRNNDMRPYLYVTRDFGRSWSSIAADLPAFGCVNVVKQDPRNPAVLYVGTEFGFFVSLDEGKAWKPLMTGLPPVRVDDVLVHPRDSDLVLATHGRSVFIMDDVTPLQQLRPEVLARDVHFFEPRAALVVRPEQRLARALPGNKHFRGANPEAGVALHYYLKQRAQGAVKLTVTELATGKVVRALDGAGEAGINRVQWDLLGESPRRAAGEEMDEGPPPAAPLARPGAYRVTLAVNGAEHARTVVVEDEGVAPGTAAPRR